MKKRTGINSWNIKNSAEMYGVENWGGGFFNINKDGEVTVSLRKGDSLQAVSLYQIIKGLEERGITMPVLMHFPDLVFNRIDRINKSFHAAIKEYGYNGYYRGVYPIKVNQQQHIVEEMVRFGAPYNYGLEAGSKPELMIAISSIKSKEPLIICNGYKDEEFIDIALYGAKLGLNIFLVIERPGEANTIISRARKIGVKPNIGIRAKLSSSVGGKWSESAGAHSVFGLTASQMIDVIDLFKKEHMIDCLRFLHYHMGSQIPDIRHIREAAGEAARIYISMVREGAPMEYMDIGGGLAIDYDGSRTTFENSKNYSMEEYCRTVIDLLKDTFDDAEVKHPNIVSESGRAVSAYSSVLVFNILDVNSLIPENGIPEIHEKLNENIINLKDILNAINIKNIQENYHDAIFYRDELRNLFQIGKVTLRERAIAEELFWLVIKKISGLAGDLKYIPEEMKMLESIMADVYFGNFSLFQSLPDCWAIDQLFPVMPLHRLGEQPANHAIISDTTCDCDGKIDKFIGLHDIKRSIMLHTLKKNEDYILGVFLVGAYQETLGDLHNLFGDTHVIGIVMNEDGEIELTREISGDSVSDVLSYVKYDTQLLLEQIRTIAELGVKEKRVTAKQRKEIMSAFEEGMRGYTYFEL